MRKGREEEPPREREKGEEPPRGRRKLCVTSSVSIAPTM